MKVLVSGSKRLLYSTYMNVTLFMLIPKLSAECDIQNSNVLHV